MAQKWWWDGMYRDIDNIVSSYPECAIVSGGGNVRTPPLCLIPIQRPFQRHHDSSKDIQGISICLGLSGLSVEVAYEFCASRPMCPSHSSNSSGRDYPKCLGSQRPLALLSDQGTNLLSHLLLDVCAMLGIQKLNTTAYHPQYAMG